MLLTIWRIFLEIANFTDRSTFSSQESDADA